MTTTIEQMARDAGAIPIHGAPKDLALVSIDRINRFAQLVREAHTKELLAGVGEPVATKTEGGAYGSITLHIPWDETPGGTKLYTADKLAAAVLAAKKEATK